MSLAFRASADPHATQFDLRIARQPLTAALKDLGLATRLNIGYMIRGSRGDEVPLAGPLEGRYTIESALSQLLAETGLTYNWVDPGTINITRAGAEPGIQALGPVAAPKTSFVEDDEARSGSGSAATGRMAMVTGAETSSVGTSDQYPDLSVSEILVTATKLLNRDIRRGRDDIQPYVVFDRRMIEQTQATNVESFLKERLTMVTSASAPNQLATGGNVSSIALRGLSGRETLILIDGHRAAGSNQLGASQQPDLNGIPLSAVERIEVLPTSASGIYGGSATGGVINVILRRDYEGVETKLTYGNTFSGEAAARRADVSAGLSFEEGRTNILVSASYSDEDPLATSERDLARRGREAILRNNPGAFANGFLPPLGRTTNILSAGLDFDTFETLPLTLKDGTPLNSTFTFVPDGYAGFESDGGAGLVANAGRYNLALAETAQDGGGARQNLLSAPTVKSLMVTLRREFTPSISGYVDMMGSENESSFLYNGASSNFLVSASSPLNPFEQDIWVTTPSFGTDGNSTQSLESRRIVSGIIAKVGEHWQGGLDFTWHRNEFSASTPGQLAVDPFFTPIAQAAIEAGVLNVMRDTNQFPVDFAPYQAQRNEYLPTQTTLRNLALQLGGPVFTLAGGPVSLSTRIERQKETLSESRQRTATFADSFSEAIYPSRWQTTDSVYLESHVPVVSALNAVPGISKLEFQLGVRHDEYEIVGGNRRDSHATPVVRTRNDLSSTDPLLGLQYAPIPDVTFRASYGTGFLPPSMDQLVATEAVLDAGLASAFGITDPRRGDEPLGTLGDVRWVTGGNPDLKPEESKSTSVGVIVYPRFAPGLRVSADWTRIEKTDEILLFSLDPAYIAQEAEIPGLIVRGPVPAGDPFGVGPIVEYHGQLLNIARREIEAVELGLEYAWATQSVGTFSFSALATHSIDNQSQLAATSDVLENVGYISGLEWQGNAMLRWESGPWNLAWATRYFDSYLIGSPDFTPASTIASQGGRSVPSQIYHDLFASFSFNGLHPATSDLEIQLGIKNVFDKEPPFDVTNFTGSYYSFWGDPRQASYYLTLRKGF